MKLLVDENLPKRLKEDFEEHEILTVRDQGWQGTENGELLELMISHSFDVLITFDKNIQHQQNFEKYPVAVLLLTAPSNRYVDIKPLVDRIKEALVQPTAGVTLINA